MQATSSLDRSPRLLDPPPNWLDANPFQRLSRRAAHVYGTEHAPLLR